ncbi:MAG: succinate dehydrogenase/fumarate reductase iron-sulfur subunit [Frankiaceae bacterium]|nr:succinate dehydrogenase/fumarate reductase iron-sulfur subunit [Frankiaceae bacterium]MBV9368945.1 succinate dehydrogenase/fumarate reductase iron-sulfur subunit [Frankiales bacterium]
MGYDLNLRVWRGDASGGDFTSYSVPVEEGEVVLDAIHRLQAEQAPDLAVRWNCKAGKCGSCSAEINGKPRLMCMTRLSSFDPTETITVTPMRTFPVIRDLVTDVSFNFEKAREVPAFAPASSNSGGTFRMAQVDVERGQEFRKCIECFLCQNTCHVIRDHEENKPSFAGPRFFIRYAELDMHPLDTLDRRQMAQESEGLGYCNITKCCSEVCPEGIHITDNGIIPLKERVVDTKYDPVFLGLRIGRRKDRRVAGPAGGSGPSPIKRPGGVAAGSRVPVAAAAAAPSGALASAPAAAPPPVRAVSPAVVTKPAEPTVPSIPASGSGVPAADGHGGVADKAKTALPAVGAAAGIGFLAWALRHTRRK